MKLKNKRIKTIKKCFSSALTVILCIVMLTLSASAEKYNSWYVMRNNNHTQPTEEKYFSFIKNYDCFYVDKENADEKTIYLTFDAGYENGNIEKILDILKKHNVKGAFFILENLIKRNPELVLRMVNEGHTVCNHTATHKDMSACTDFNEFKAELERLDNAFYELTGENIQKYYRPPEGKFSEENLKFAQKLGYKTVLWSFAYADWDNNKQPSTDEAKRKILDNVHCGEIMLLHPTSSANVQILDEVLSELEEGGWSFGTLDKLGTD